jgi:hypothetical protein
LFAGEGPLEYGCDIVACAAHTVEREASAGGRLVVDALKKEDAGDCPGVWPGVCPEGVWPDGVCPGVGDLAVWNWCRYGGVGACRAKRSLMIVPKAKRSRTPLGSVSGLEGSWWLEGLILGEVGGVQISSSLREWILGGCSSIEVTTFSRPSARSLRLRARVRSCVWSLDSSWSSP